MTITTITSTFSVSGEISEETLIDLVENGVTTLINVRPDNESPQQHRSKEWSTVCQQHGIRYIHIPVLPCQYSASDIQKFKDALNNSKNKTHSFCRTGTRAVHLFALATKATYTFQQMRALLKDKGYDLHPIERQFKEGEQNLC